MKLIWIILLVVLIFGALIIGGYKLINVSLVTEEENTATQNAFFPGTGDSNPAVNVDGKVLFPTRDGNGVLVKNFRNDPTVLYQQSDVGDDYIIIDKREYIITAASSVGFQIVVFGRPYSTWIEIAEDDLLNKLEISEKDACRLQISVYLLEKDSGTEVEPIGLSFCN